MPASAATINRSKCAARFAVMASFQIKQTMASAARAHERAKPLLERALDIWEKALGPNHPDVAAALNNLAGLYRAQGAYERARPLFERALAVWEKALGPEHPDTKTARRNLAALRRAAEGGAQAHPKIARNDPCTCGSGKRYKHCHGALH
jgi:tetratricopeptide (TPR) repeat protein